MANCRGGCKVNRSGILFKFHDSENQGEAGPSHNIGKHPVFYNFLQYWMSTMHPWINKTYTWKETAHHYKSLNLIAVLVSCHFLEHGDTLVAWPWHEHNTIISECLRSVSQIQWHLLSLSISMSSIHGLFKQSPSSWTSWFWLRLRWIWSRVPSSYR